MTIAPSPNGNILICVLGDSFAAGLSADTGNGNNGYRADLLNNLIGPGEVHNLTMVGSQVSGTAGLHHEGHSGWTIGQITSLVQGGALANPAPALAGPPQIIILTVGSNDFGAGHLWPQVLADMSTLLDLLLALPSTPVVVVTQQVEQSGSVSHVLTTNSVAQQPYNLDLDAVVASKPVGRVLIARCDDIPQQDLDSSGVHPIDVGYRMMSYHVYRALAPVLGRDDGTGRWFMPNRPDPYATIPSPL